jgi:hypothetical protein
MSAGALLTTTDLREIFAREVTALGGSVTDVFDDGIHFYGRSVLPGVEEVVCGDRVQGGVAVRSNERGVLVHPYTFRQICRNGAIVAQAVETRQVDFADFETPVEAAEATAEAVALSGAPEAFRRSVGRMRTARETRADLALNLIPMLSRFPDGVGESVMRMVFEEFLREEDQSLYGLFNAVTAVAREQRDPETRWRLEEFGGGLLVARPRTAAPGGSSARALVAV